MRAATVLILMLLLFGWLLIATLIMTPLKEAFRSRGVKSRITRLGRSHSRD